MMHFTDSQWYTIAHGLRIAAERFSECAAASEAAKEPRLAAQFIKQRDESIALAEQIEEVYA